MTKQFKVGDKVRVLDVSKIWFGSSYYYDGQETEVVALHKGCPKLRSQKGRAGIFISHGEFDAIEIISPKSEKPKRMAELESRIAELERQVAELTPKKFVATAQSESLMTTNQQRKATIERAKAFVADLTERAKSCKSNNEGNVFFRHYTTVPEFHVNNDKRVVTALVKGATIPKLYSKGIAKCAPDDVFNTDIGKAIALGRALGLDVSEFENAPKPTEVVMGMVVAPKYSKWCAFKVSEIKGEGDVEELYDYDGTWIHTKETIISEDTEAQYV